MMENSLTISVLTTEHNKAITISSSNNSFHSTNKLNKFKIKNQHQFTNERNVNLTVSYGFWYCHR